ncbi:MAG: hypothetical protein JWO71_4503 [Candidatus Acidoferrum typicum]|nr:hypothetical protein [Candidatus Acidoferrum typicum]
MSSLRSIYEDARTTLRGWAKYKRQTGKLPWLSIIVHTLHWIVMLSGIGAIVWLSGRFRWTRWQFLGAFFAAGLPYGILSLVIKRRVLLNQIRNGRRLAMQRKLTS